MSPAPTPVNTPLLLTVATEALDDCHVAELVTFCVVPLESVAVAVSCAVSPIDGGDPVTATLDTVGDGLGVGVGVGVGVPGLELLPLHASVNAADAVAIETEIAHRFIVPLRVVR